MYSRYKNTTYDPQDQEESADMSDEEYELYRYNLPPRYDGNRFRHQIPHQKKAANDTSKPSVPAKATDRQNTEKSAEPSPDSDATETRVQSSHLLTSKGYEDVLIICIVLLITEKSDSTYDVILLLLILLAAK